jgi:hypothetical protein
LKEYTEPIIDFGPTMPETYCKEKSKFKKDFSEIPSWNSRLLYSGEAELTVDDYWSI